MFQVFDLGFERMKKTFCLETVVKKLEGDLSKFT